MCDHRMGICLFLRQISETKNGKAEEWKIGYKVYNYLLNSIHIICSSISSINDETI